MHVHLDTSEIEAMLDRGRQAMSGMVGAPGVKGAQARMAITLDHAFIRQFTAEVNLGTAADDIAQALAGSFANMIVSYVDSTVADGDQDGREETAMLLMAMMSRFVARHLADQSRALFAGMVPVKCGGRA